MLFSLIILVTTIILPSYASVTVENIENVEIRELVVDILNRLDDKEERIKALEKRNHEYELRFETLINEINTQKQIIAELKDTMETKCENQAGQFKTSTIIKEITKAQQAKGDTNTEDDVHAPHHSQQTRQVNTDDQIAFFATLTNNLLQPSTAHSPVAFDNILTNFGNAYNQHSGKFTAKVAGIYVFSVSLLTYPPYNADIAYEFTRNATAVSRLYFRASTTRYETASQTIILHLKVGDFVALENYDLNDRLSGNHYSTFCGFLLEQTYENSGVVIGK